MQVLFSVLLRLPSMIQNNKCAKIVTNNWSKTVDLHIRHILDITRTNRIICIFQVFMITDRSIVSILFHLN